jgi:putative transposase
VTVTCRVLRIARQPYYRWLAAPVTVSELARAYRADALFDAHRDDPEFGYRLLVDEAVANGQPMTARTAWAICAVNQWWSAFGKPRRGRSGRPGRPRGRHVNDGSFDAFVAERSHPRPQPGVSAPVRSQVL